MTTASYSATFRIVAQAIRIGAGELSHAVRAADVAQEVGFSEFHFQRIFHAMAGESWGGFHRRLRLERAAARLQTSKDPVFVVAASAGFEGPEPFVRAFRKAYGLSPGRFRQCRFERPLLPTPNGVHDFDPGSVERFVPLARAGSRPDFGIAAIPPIPLIAMEHRGALQFISEAWRRLAQWAAERDIRLEERTLVTFADDLDDDTPPENQIGYVALDDRGEVGLIRKSVGGGEFLVAKHIGSGHLLADFWFRIYGEAVPLSGRILRQAPAFQIYPNGLFTSDPAKFETTIYVPVEPESDN